jgi:predicted ABC-type transport system involved in lysophospholipase L1 biosynthesis ATPase subunit
MNAHRLVIIAAALTTIVTAALATALATFSSQALPRAVRHDLGHAPGTTLSISGSVNASQAAQYDAVLPPQIRSALGGTAFALAYRRQVVGFIWQQTSRNLLPYLTAQQNVELPMRLARARPRARRERAVELLELLGLGECLHRRPDQMSGDEQQRAAIAVALTNDPKVLLADEPTGELDSVTAAEVFSALQKANVELGVTVLIVTHDPAVSSVVRRVVAIRDGRTSTETLRDTLAGDGQVVPHAVE